MLMVGRPTARYRIAPQRQPPSIGSIGESVPGRARGRKPADVDRAARAVNECRAVRPDTWRFYASEVSNFSAKVRPALRYKGVRYAEILATPAAYRGVIRPRVGFN